MIGLCATLSSKKIGKFLIKISNTISDEMTPGKIPPALHTSSPTFHQWVIASKIQSFCIAIISSKNVKNGNGKIGHHKHNFPVFFMHAKFWTYKYINKYKAFDIMLILKNTQLIMFWKGILLFHLQKKTFMQKKLKYVSLCLHLWSH